MNNIFVVGLDMDHRTPEDIGREAALKINDIVEGLIAERDAKKNETMGKEDYKWKSTEGVRKNEL